MPIFFSERKEKKISVDTNRKINRNKKYKSRNTLKLRKNTEENLCINAEGSILR